ncbi:MAG TPA: acyltransferase family protein [Solirubrobacterales bacterium]|nr:acyltransferase family protein [Solirubrobacterales bacterium]
MFLQTKQPPEAGARSGGEGFRPDIEGLRAVAIIAVLLCHAGIGIFAGGYVGVDVFFVVSGYLITRLLLGEYDRHGSISIPQFYARRAKRILPLCAVLLLFVAVMSLVLLSPLRSTEVSGDIVASALYIANWHFAAASVNYFQLGVEPSPLLHLWSLGIEEQFYLVWPTLLIALTWIGRRLGGRERPVIWTVLAVLFVGSLALGIHETAVDPAWAYFSTFDRGWELALGGALALLGPVRLRPPLAQALGWTGMAAIVWSILAYDAHTSFPGAAALVPTVGTAALILAGTSLLARPEPSPAAALSLPPVRYVGRISYSWYLWHWPFLIFGAVIFGPLSTLAASAVLALSVVPTVLTHHLIEEPARRAKILVTKPARGLMLGACCMAVGVLAGVMLTRVQPTLPTLAAGQAEGAAALAHEPRPEEHAAAIRPTPLDAPEDVPRPIHEGCLEGIEGTVSHPCVYGDPDGERTVILFGDSHAMQYFPALEPIATTEQWRLVVLTKRECSPVLVPIENEAEESEYSQCDAWRENSLGRIEAEAEAGPVTVVLGGDNTDTAYGPTGEALEGAANARALESGYTATLERVRGAGAVPLVIVDDPEAPFDVPSCVSEHLHDFGACSFPDQVGPDLEFERRAAAGLGVATVDLTPEICPGGLCRAVIGNVLVYRDTAHLTATYARTLAPWLQRAVVEAIRR